MNKENIPTISTSDLITLLQNMDDQVILTLISDVPLNSPKLAAKLLYDEIFADLDREIFAVVNPKASLEAVGMKVLAADSDKKIRNLYPSSVTRS
ncbi:MAG: hypothetical protein SOW08_04655 [Lachnospiraceae bacterium]|nr:hypothetical protein [Lachnospiraceae bacterium]